MDSQINTGGGAAIQGDATVQGNLIGRDQINNIVIVGNLLHFAQIEGLFPNNQQLEDFSSITEAVESILGAHLSSELAGATSFAGEILGDFIPKYIKLFGDFPIVLSWFAPHLVDRISERLEETGYWYPFCQTGNDKWEQILWLQATNVLWKKQFARNICLGIGRADFDINDPRNSFSIPATYIYRIVFRKKGHIEELDVLGLDLKSLRVIILGILLDLIRMGAEASITSEFIKGLADQFPPAKK